MVTSEPGVLPLRKPGRGQRSDIRVCERRRVKAAFAQPLPDSARSGRASSQNKPAAEQSLVGMVESRCLPVPICRLRPLRLGLADGFPGRDGRRVSTPRHSMVSVFRMSYRSG